jgi:mono/diheme cytochrome c family protein
MRIHGLIAAIAFGAAAFAGAANAAEGPFTADQLNKGKSEYNTHCRTCHAANGKGALGPALQGDTFKGRFGGQNFADIATWIHQNMPQTAPGSLTDEQLYPIVSYIMSLNGFTPGQTALSADTAKTVTLEE